jgi:hypothetical protein
MGTSDYLAGKAKNMSPGWARGFLKASAAIERGKEFAKTLKPPPPLGKPKK